MSDDDLNQRILKEEPAPSKRKRWTFHEALSHDLCSCPDSIIVFWDPKHSKYVIHFSEISKKLDPKKAHNFANFVHKINLLPGPRDQAKLVPFTLIGFFLIGFMSMCIYLIIDAFLRQDNDLWRLQLYIFIPISVFILVVLGVYLSVLILYIKVPFLIREKKMVEIIEEEVKENKWKEEGYSLMMGERSAWVALYFPRHARFGDGYHNLKNVLGADELFEVGDTNTDTNIL